MEKINPVWVLFQRKYIVILSRVLQYIQTITKNCIKKTQTMKKKFKLWRKHQRLAILVGRERIWTTDLLVLSRMTYPQRHYGIGQIKILISVFGDFCVWILCFLYKYTCRPYKPLVTSVLPFQSCHAILQKVFKNSLPFKI